MWFRIGSELINLEHLECARVQNNHLILYYKDIAKYNKIFQFTGENADKEAQEVLEAISNRLKADVIALSKDVVQDPDIYKTFYGWDYELEVYSEVKRVESRIYAEYQEKYELWKKKQNKKLKLKKE